jgi:hypothetical protein
MGLSSRERAAPFPKIAKWLGTGFGDLCGHAKPWLHRLLPVQPHQGTFRFAPLLPLTRLNWRPSARYARRLFGAVKRGSEATLDGLKQAKKLDVDFGESTAVTKIISDEKLLKRRQTREQRSAPLPIHGARGFQG